MFHFQLRQCTSRRHGKNSWFRLHWINIQIHGQTIERLGVTNIGNVFVFCELSVHVYSGQHLILIVLFEFVRQNTTASLVCLRQYLIHNALYFFLKCNLCLLIPPVD